MKIRETLVLKGPFTNTACLNESFQAAQLTATGGLGTSVTGQCQGNTFVFTDGNGGVAEKDTKTVTEQVGTPTAARTLVDYPNRLGLRGLPRRPSRRSCI